jgi:alkanesulfonate monooxygenase SsuD/methylene tetrahydromethanopterin reductase-like flavin-dependent oxidoreductase (luciferase family)
MKTSRIFVAAGVFNVYSRSAALLAQTSATLQTVSGGRFILGLGASGPGVIER